MGGRVFVLVAWMLMNVKEAGASELECHDIEKLTHEKFKSLQEAGALSWFDFDFNFKSETAPDAVVTREGSIENQKHETLQSLLMDLHGVSEEEALALLKGWKMREEEDHLSGWTMEGLLKGVEEMWSSEKQRADSGETINPKQIPHSRVEKPNMDEDPCTYW